MTSALPLFPLGTVLFPGLVLPLRVFEERYRSLVRHLMALPDDSRREFGVVAIRRGWEVDAGMPVTLYDVGCTAEVREITERDDGQLDLVTVGRQRFEVARIVPADTPYLQAEVRFLPEPEDRDGSAEQLAPRVLAAFREYLRLVRLESEEVTEQLPDNPLVLSHLVAATARLTLADRQQLLSAPDTATRLQEELLLLRREAALLRQVPAVPVAVSELPVRPGRN